MYRHLFPKCLLITAIAGVSLISTVQAQDLLIDAAKEEAARVIQLKNQLEVKEAVAEVSSRTTRLALNPLSNLNNPVVSTASTKVTSAPQVAFDEIDGSNSDNSFKPSSFKSPSVQAPKVSQTKVQEKFTQPKVYIQDKQTPASNVSYAKRSSTGVVTSAPVRRNESAPFVTTTVSVPEFVNVDEVVTVKIDVRNQGKIPVNNVKLVANLPSDVQIESRQGQVQAGMCSFEINSLQPGDSRQLTMDVVTTQKQPLNIQTALTISNRSSIKVGVRQPKLAISVKGPEQANIGSKATHIITVTNTGDGVARRVNLIADIPDWLHITEKSGFESPETLAPGQSAKARIVTVPHQSGQAELAFAAAGKLCKAKPAEAGLRVTQPELRVAAIGPDMNFVERDGIYTITIDNPGEVDVNNVEVEFAIPDGVTVTTISRKAKMDGQRGTLSWKFGKIESQTEQTIQLKAVASTEGEKHCRIRVASDETNEKEVSLKTVIATRAELSIQMQNIGGPVQLGNEATFVVVVENRGSSVASDMEIEVQLPAGMKPASPRDGVVDEDSNSILFADSELRPGKVREFKFSAIGVEKGEHVVRSSLESVGSKQRIIVENSVFVYEPAQARVSESLQPTIPRR